MTTGEHTGAPSGAGEAFDLHIVLVLARKEIRDSLRNRWFVLYTIGFCVLALALSYISLIGTGQVGFAGFGRTAAGLINLVILIVPLMALTSGASALAGEYERGTLSYLLAQPVNRIEVIAGKYLGLSAALIASLALGFGLTAAVIAWRSGTADAWAFVQLVILAIALAMGMLSVGMLVSVFTRRTSVAIGVVVFIWLGLVFAGDLGLMGSAIAFRLEIDQLFMLAILNPLQVFKMAALASLNTSLDVLGPAGLYATRSYGGALNAIFFAVLGAWIILPLMLGAACFGRRSVA